MKLHLCALQDRIATYLFMKDSRYYFLFLFFSFLPLTLLCCCCWNSSAHVVLKVQCRHCDRVVSPPTQLDHQPITTSGAGTPRREQETSALPLASMTLVGRETRAGCPKGKLIPESATGVLTLCRSLDYAHSFTLTGLTSALHTFTCLSPYST